MSTVKIILIAHNLRSCYNVGSLLRTCDGLGVEALLCTGTTPTPKRKNDPRLPHVRERAHRQIAKTALGAEETVPCHYFANLKDAVTLANDRGYTTIALEQAASAIPLNDYASPSQSLALVVGPEVNGLDQVEIDLCQYAIEIPMHGKKRSLNVSVAAAIALYALQQ